MCIDESRPKAQPRHLRTRSARVFLGVAVWLLGFGCSENSKIAEKAEWLCKQNLLESPQLTAFSPAHPAENYVAEADLSRLREEDAERPLAFATLGVDFQRVRRGIRAALAERTRCAVSVKMDNSGVLAAVKVKQMRPEFTAGSLRKVYEDVAQLETPQEVQEHASELLERSYLKMETSEFDLTFVKESEQWVARFDFEIREKLEELDGELGRLREDRAELEDVRSAALETARALAKLAVAHASLSKEKDALGESRPKITMTVENNTADAIARVLFQGRMTSAGRSVPWIEEEFSHGIAGGLEPGESATWELHPKPFTPWATVEVPDDATLDVTVVAIEGVGGSVIAELPHKPQSFRGEHRGVAAVDVELKVLDEKIAEVEATKAGLMLGLTRVGD